MRKRKLASAIGYSPEDPAPKVLALGRDREAEHIIAVARESGVVIVEDEALAALLDSSAGPGDFIPSWCWEAVAKILIFVTKGDSSEIP
jgi:flagellar biosynthesis protein